ncbi:MAG: tripartite tricarboxylate transporter substrate binding protein [Hyphomicrobiaceae bacterium]|nr:tripartite tricarboxylate transporter substrate binding protein [Hyphomicrobiaceae bacterium]
MRGRSTGRWRAPSRRVVLKALAGAPLAAPAVSLLASAARAQWPSGTITMVVPFPPGGQADLAARPVADALQRALGTTVVVENRSGAGGAVGNAAAAKAAPDGQTLLMTLSSLAVLPVAARLFERQPLYEVAQLRPVARVLADPTMLAVPAKAPWKTVADLVAEAKAKPSSIAYGSSGPYGTLHVAMEMFCAAAGIRMNNVNYRGAGPALNDLVAGQIQAMASAPGTLRQHVSQGSLRVLACWGAQRAPAFPDVPTFRELGFADVEFYIWAGLFVPAAVPEPIFERVRAAMRDVMRAPEVLSVFEKAGSPPAYQDAPEFARFVESDSARLVAAVQKIGKVAEQ